MSDLVPDLEIINLEEGPRVAWAALHEYLDAQSGHAPSQLEDLDDE